MKRLLTGLLFFSPLCMLGQGYQLNLQGTRQIGMGSTGIANPKDATSLFYNPGSSAFAGSNNVALGISPAISKGSFTDANSGKITYADNPVVTPFNASVLLGNPNSRFRYGLAVYTPFGSTMNWEKGSAGRFDVRKISLVSVAVQPTVSYKLTDRLGIGAGFVYGYGHVNIQKDVPVSFSNGDFGTAEINARANSYGFNAGLYYEFSKQFSGGLTYRSALKMKTASGTAKFNVPTGAASNFPDQGINAKLPLPQVFGVGFSYKPNDKLTINLDGTLSDWTPYDTIHVYYGTAPVAGESEAELIRNYKHGFSVRVGGEYKISRQWEARAGFIVSKSPIKDQYVAADVPDANRVNPTLGLSYICSPRWRIDAGFMYEHITRQSKNVVTNIDGTYKFNLYIPTIGLTYQF